MRVSDHASTEISRKTVCSVPGIGCVHDVGVSASGFGSFAFSRFGV